MSKFTLKFILFFSIVISLFCTEKINRQETIKENENFESVIAKISNLTQNQILVCAHRAYHKNAPENSLESIKQAIEAGIDIVEIDINTTKDGVLVLMHDNKVDRTTNGKGYVSDYTFAELNKLYLKIGDSITTHKIPKLNEVLALAKDKIILNLDIKRVDVSKLYKQLLARKMQNEVFSFIWDRGKIDKILAIDSTYAILPLVSSKEQMIFYASNVKSKLQHFDEKSYNSENMDWAKKNDILVFMNILWDPDKQFLQNNTTQVDRIIDLQPAIIQTDHPKKILQYLKSKKLHN